MKRIYFLARTSILLFSILYLTSCKETEENGPVLTPNQEVATGKSAAEEAYPGEYGTAREGTLFGRQITYSEINNQAILEGDIILATNQLNATEPDKNARVDAAGVSLAALRWEKGIVYYTIDRSLANKDIVKAAITYVESTTPIRFVLRTTEPNHVTFKPGRGYSSSIGVVGGQQFIELPVSFTVGTTLHEIGHTIGLFHEHTRVDRNETIKVNLNNVAEAAQVNFTSYQGQGKAGFDFALLDPGSIMMLDSYAFSKNSQPTMTFHNGSIFQIQRDHFSTKDIDCITAMYANLYLMKYDRLFAVSLTNGQRAEIPGGWGSSETVTSTKDFIFNVRTGYIWKSSKLNGKATTVKPYFSETKGMAMYKGDLYVLKNGYLVKVNVTTGATVNIGEQIWVPATAMTYLNGFLYIISGDVLFRVTPETGTYVSIGGTYKGATEITTMIGHLWVIKNSELHRVHPMSGADFKLSSFWSAKSQMTSFEGNLYITESGRLYKVDSYGDREILSYDWDGTYQLTATDY